MSNNVTRINMALDMRATEFSGETLLRLDEKFKDIRDPMRYARVVQVVICNMLSAYGLQRLSIGLPKEELDKELECLLLQVKDMIEVAGAYEETE